MHEGGMNCEEMKVAMLKREHGLLDEPVRRDVEAHLATCPDCAQMAALGEALVALKHAAPRAVPSSEGLIKHNRLRAMRAALCATALIVAFPLLQWILGASQVVVVVTAGLAAAAALVVWVIVRRRQARFHRLASSRHFLSSLRQHIEEDLQAINRAPLAGVLILAMGGAMSGVGGTNRVFLLIAGAMITGAALYLRARALPQLRAELAELGAQE
jgi:hypothetical protein